jgi:hypothetical protein
LLPVVVLVVLAQMRAAVAVALVVSEQVQLYL